MIRNCRWKIRENSKWKWTKTAKITSLHPGALRKTTLIFYEWSNCVLRFNFEVWYEEGKTMTSWMRIDFPSLVGAWREYVCCSLWRVFFVCLLVDMEKLFPHWSAHAHAHTTASSPFHPSNCSFVFSSRRTNHLVRARDAMLGEKQWWEFIQLVTSPTTLSPFLMLFLVYRNQLLSLHGCQKKKHTAFCYGSK